MPTDASVRAAEVPCYNAGGDLFASPPPPPPAQPAKQGTQRYVQAHRLGCRRQQTAQGFVPQP